MCFSPVASFTASAALAFIGVVTLKETKTRHEALFIGIPFIFAIQQFVEGLIWLALLNENTSQLQTETYLYLFFVGLWPIIIPLSIFLIETHKYRKIILLLILVIGISTSFYDLIALINYGISAKIINQCIRYHILATPNPCVLLPYVIATCGPFFFSSHRSIIWIGMANIIGFTAAYYLYEENFVSVWCFFGAVLSILIYLHLRHIRFNAWKIQAVV